MGGSACCLLEPLGHIKVQYIDHPIPIESPQSVALAGCCHRYCSVLHIPFRVLSSSVFSPPLLNMPTVPVGPRAPKDEFMRALGLNPSDVHHEGYYRAMRVGSSA
jgi:hypothetical protein